ncbi:MAG TPA: nitroreductase family deazaflavin-dependent oxidoreductase, partial [Thermomicrobiales bacterium]|nr:nitroreductase family deazaflavin-dependent oxidoreductase [Thermomicrobiales bacterium]
MTEGTRQWLNRTAGERNAYLTTIGRRSGEPHRIEIWFAADDGRVFLLAGGRDRADWVRNLRANAHVTIEVGDEAHAAMARILDPGTPEDRCARQLLVAKYARPDDLLEEWGRSSRPIVVEFAAKSAECEH